MATEITINVDHYKAGDYSYDGWNYQGKTEIGVDEKHDVLYIVVEGQKIGIDTKDARRIFDFFLNK